jgi:hypothetical protein
VPVPLKEKSVLAAGVVHDHDPRAVGGNFDVHFHAAVLTFES